MVVPILWIRSGTPQDHAEDFVRTSWVATVFQAREESNVSEPEERQDGVKPDSDPCTGKSDADRAKDKEQEMEESGEELPG